MNKPKYNTQISVAGGLYEELLVLIGLWEEGMSKSELFSIVWQRGHFFNVSESTIKKYIRVFYTRFVDTGFISDIRQLRSPDALYQTRTLMMMATATAYPILSEFYRYWVGTGKDEIAKKDVYSFVELLCYEGETDTHWNTSTIQSVASAIVSISASLGWISINGNNLHFKMNSASKEEVFYLATKLRLQGLINNSIVHHSLWALFHQRDGAFIMSRIQNKMIMQSVGGTAFSIGWCVKEENALADAIEWLNS